MNTINVHEYPKDNANTLEYIAAVTKAYCTDGQPLQGRARGEGNEWFDVCQGDTFNWHDFEYRIAAPKIAKGHNPHNVTDDQLGIKAGWRLLEGAEIGRHRTEATQEIQAWGGDQWLTCPYCGADEDQTYRTKKPEGYFLPQPAVPLAELDDKALTGYIDSVPDGLAESLSSVLTQVWNAALKYERSRAK